MGIQVMDRAAAVEGANDVSRPPAPPKSLLPGKTRLCPECGVKFTTRQGQGRHQQFCTPAHRAKFYSRCAARGKVILPYLMAWRGRRGSRGIGATAFHEICSILDAFANEDRAAGRPKMDAFVKGIFDSGFLYKDRRRK